jgi:hypothetical protein
LFAHFRQAVCTRKAPAQDGEREGMGRAHSHRQNMEKGATMEASQGNAEHVCMEPRLTTNDLSYIIGKGNVRKSPCATVIGSIFAGAGLRQPLPPPPLDCDVNCDVDPACRLRKVQKGGKPISAFPQLILLLPVIACYCNHLPCRLKKITSTRKGSYIRRGKMS